MTSSFTAGGDEEAPNIARSVVGSDNASPLLVAATPPRRHRSSSAATESPGGTITQTLSSFLAETAGDVDNYDGSGAPVTPLPLRVAPQTTSSSPLTDSPVHVPASPTKATLSGTITSIDTISLPSASYHFFKVKPSSSEESFASIHSNDFDGEG
jgi:hypothetical protein